MKKRLLSWILTLTLMLSLVSAMQTFFSFIAFMPPLNPKGATQECGGAGNSLVVFRQNSQLRHMVSIAPIEVLLKRRCDERSARLHGIHKSRPSFSLK